ncbi:hypothetical protein BRAO375_820014 [Bradyrhizobium sp. ORS 375]|nr:hypothetical protein BRAO375_820014 [Bradyrhizobium sp. ORS 375]
MFRSLPCRWTVQLSLARLRKRFNGEVPGAQSAPGGPRLAPPLHCNFYQSCLEQDGGHVLPGDAAFPTNLSAVIASEAKQSRAARGLWIASLRSQ